MRETVRGHLEELSGGSVLFDEPLAAWTSFRIGGPADAVVLPRGMDSLQRILAFVREEGTPYFVMGRGTNLVVSDAGFRGVVITLQEGFKNMDRTDAKGADRVLLTAEAGVYLPRLVRRAAQDGMSGLEFAAGIPGSVGGAIAMNAGSWGGEMSDRVHSVRILKKDGTIEDWGRDRLSFGYRAFSRPRGSIVLSATFSLDRTDPALVASTVSANLARKRASQPLRQPSAGSVFKNPAQAPAARLIDMAGLKGTRCGGAMVSRKHANFIVNKGGAGAADVLRLVELVRSRVYERFGVTLEPEVEVIGQDL